MAKGIYIGVDNLARKVKKAYIGVAEDSLVVNGDFSDGLEGWKSYQQTKLELLNENNMNYVKASAYYTNGASGGLAQSYGITIGHKYYGCAFVKGDLNNTGTNTDGTILNISLEFSNLILVYTPINIYEWTFLSDVGEAIYDTCEGRVSFPQRVQGDCIYAKDIKFYDLTEMFGSGKEPTKEWCDNNLEALENLYKLQNGIARKVKKGYIGVDGVAKQFYSAETLVPFTSNPAPTSWTGSVLSATASNDYGEWSVVASSGATVYHSFDSDTSTYWKSDSYTTEQYVEIYCPNGVSIKPKNISVRYSRFKSGSIFGLDISTGTWKKIFDMSYSSSTVKTETFMYEGESYFSAFRVRGYLYSDSYSDRRVYDFKITSGTLKIE